MLITISFVWEQLVQMLFEPCAVVNKWNEGFAVLCPVFLVYSPEPLTGHISGTCPRAQQRPVSQQHCILVYWPVSSAAQRPLARAEKQVPTRWSEEEEMHLQDEMSQQAAKQTNLSWRGHHTEVKKERCTCLMSLIMFHVSLVTVMKRQLLDKTSFRWHQQPHLHGSWYSDYSQSKLFMNQSTCQLVNDITWLFSGCLSGRGLHNMASLF